MTTEKRPQINMRLTEGVADLLEQLRAAMADLPGEPIGTTETIRRLIVAEAKRRKIKPRGGRQHDGAE
jgi:hypothetical protein